MKKASNLFLVIEIIILIISAVSLIRLHNIRKTRESYAYAQQWNYSINQVEPVYNFSKFIRRKREIEFTLKHL